VTSKKAVFLDRDGTIIRDAHYLSDPAQVELLPDAAKAIGMLRSAGFLLFLFTNQSGIGRGFFTLESVHRCNERMVELIGSGPAVFTGICIAPESPGQPAVYRKPNPRFIDESVARHQLDRSLSWMAGDKVIDVETGINAKINAALIGTRRLPENITAPVYESLFTFARAVTARPG